MMFWLALGLLTAGTIFFVLRPLLRRAAGGPSPISPTSPAASTCDLAVYRDQLAEIDRDLARGALAPAEAEAARIEVSRRLIAAADRVEPATERPAGAAARSFRLVSAAILVLLPLGAVALYLALGSPGLPGQPLADRLARARTGEPVVADDVMTLAALVMRVEAHLKQDPDDGRGWDVIAPAYMRLERYDDATNAFGNAIRLLGATSERAAALGEAMVAAAGGVVTQDAKTEFERALALDPHNITAILYRGLAAKQAGQPEEARRIWEGMISRAPEGAPWVSFVRQAIAALGDPAAPAIDAARRSDAPAELTTEQREMARVMVERLAARLAENGSDVDAWLRLVRSYLVLGEPEKAKAAAMNARRSLAGDAEKLRRLDSGVKALGVEG